jgi:hypothetical protein
VDVEALRQEYKRAMGREHPVSCEEADPKSPCACECKGLLHGIAWRQNLEGKVNLLKWINR